MSQNSNARSKPFLIWAAANGLGFGAVGLISVAPPLWISGLGAVVLPTLAISLAQWIGLRWLFSISPTWILSFPAGVLLWEILRRVILEWFPQSNYDESIAALTLPYLLMGLLVGLPQWLILRRRFSGSSLWLLGSAVSLGGGLWLVLATGLVDQSGILASIVGVLVYIGATGASLTWLLSSHAQSQSQATSAA